MIFVTVGTQLPFDRLITAMDRWASRHPHTEVFAQIGNTNYLPEHLRWAHHLDPDEFRAKGEAAQVIVSHAGIGNVLLARELQKPLIVMPRRAELKEHRNDHQLATVKWLEGKPGIEVVYDIKALGQALQNAENAPKAPVFSRFASPELLTAVKEFIQRA